MRATESDPRVTELYNESTPFLDAYPDYDLALLPTWVRENIEYTVGVKDGFFFLMAESIILITS